MFILKFVGDSDETQRELMVDANEINITHRQEGLTRIEVIRNQTPSSHTATMYFLSNRGDAPDPKFQSLFIMNQDGKTIETIRATKISQGT